MTIAEYAVILPVALWVIYILTRTIYAGLTDTLDEDERNRFVPHNDSADDYPDHPRKD